MTFSAATQNREAVWDSPRARQMAITEWARQTVIAYRNLNHWPEREAAAALDYAIARLEKLVGRW